MDNKAKGSIAALVGALLYGGSQLLDMESRLEALEGLHPEVTTGVAMDPHAVEEAPQEPETAEVTGATEEPGAEPETAEEPAEEPAEPVEE